MKYTLPNTIGQMLEALQNAIGYAEEFNSDIASTIENAQDDVLREVAQGIINDNVPDKGDVIDLTNTHNWAFSSELYSHVNDALDDYITENDMEEGDITINY